MKKKIVTAVVLIAFSTFGVKAQIADSSINMLQLAVNYSFHFPSGDMVKRFGVSSAVGFSAEYKFKSNWSLGLEYCYIFGEQLKTAQQCLTI